MLCWVQEKESFSSGAAEESRPCQGRCGQGWPERLEALLVESGNRTIEMGYRGRAPQDVAAGFARNAAAASFARNAAAASRGLLNGECSIRRGLGHAPRPLLRDVSRKVTLLRGYSALRASPKRRALRKRGGALGAATPLRDAVSTRSERALTRRDHRTGGVAEREARRLALFGARCVLDVCRDGRLARIARGAVTEAERQRHVAGADSVAPPTCARGDGIDVGRWRARFRRGRPRSSSRRFRLPARVSTTARHQGRDHEHRCLANRLMHDGGVSREGR